MVNKQFLVMNASSGYIDIPCYYTSIRLEPSASNLEFATAIGGSTSAPFSLIRGHRVIVARKEHDGSLPWYTVRGRYRS
jgi:hypothetical protein